MTEFKSITLAGLSDGAAEELWGQAVLEVARNMADPNTSWRDKREIVLRFSFTQDEERRLGEVDIRCATKLAGVRGVRRPLYLGRNLGVPTMREAPSQDEMFTSPASKLAAVPSKDAG